ncbi:DnaJ domain-containing protein, putative [Eimeria maxima]|uniref:DnaJ domain-containing protein, putative n=1 Tax=Eimeria maxima TaxID=5804 RepID=U6MB31_EIMMA|nr:DnaJ domain-containing protein, putative [Eimeria maxima]CDJ58875.1 DnaJ domain-containing protein, putative [Eimeria maxima]
MENPNNREEAGRRFRDASEAYQTLSDPNKRSQYDSSLHYNYSFNNQQQTTGKGGGGRTTQTNYAHPFQSTNGGFHFTHVSAEEAENLFRRAFGGISLEQILQQALNQQNAAHWVRGMPFQRNDIFEHTMGSRSSTSFLDDHEIYELLRGFSGSRQEVGTQVSYFTRGGRVIERKTTTRRFPGGGIQTETTERDVGPDTGSGVPRGTRSASRARHAADTSNERMRMQADNARSTNPYRTELATPMQQVALVAREYAKMAWELIKISALRAFARAVVRFVTHLLTRRR